MWTLDDGSRLVSDMDSRQTCPNYEAGFDVCDPLESVVEWSGRGPARILRRRCRSEGVDRSPYEDASHDHRSADGYSRYYRQTNKSHFTLNDLEAHYDRFRHESTLFAVENGDYVMAHDNRYNGYQPGRSKLFRTSPTRPLLVTTLSNTKIDERLPKVEELLEKVDQEMMEVQIPKQPLKSILNNPIPKSMPQSILKKPKSKSYQDTRINFEGRRRQRASSESDNMFCSFHLGSPTLDRMSYLSSNIKRAKDNTGTGYSYGSAIASLGTHCKSPTNNSKAPRCICKDQTLLCETHNMHLLRTTAINNDSIQVDPVVEVPRHDTPTPTCPTVSPALPVSSVTAIPIVKKLVKTVKKAKPKVKVAKMKSTSKIECSVVEPEADDAQSRSPSPDLLDSTWHMDTDPVSLEIDKSENPPPAPILKNSLIENSVTKLSSKLNGTVVTPKKNNSKEPLLCLPESISNCVRLSLFPRVPPYLRFVSHDDTVTLRVPIPIQKHLKWKLTTITPIVVKKTLTNSGFRLVKSECDTAECPQEETVEWVGIWGKHMKSLMFRAIKDGQKMNHFPGTFQIGRKDRLWRNLQKLTAKYGIDEFGIMPKTYVLPHDLILLKRDWEKYAANNERWIIKPPASARGTGIKVVSRWAEIPKKRPVVVQRYVSKPYLINGSKFDMRLYVLVTSVHPLRIYLYKDGLARFASVKYNEELTSLNDRYMHLTNYSINRLSKNYTPNEDFAACEGHKWTLQTLFQYLKTEKNVDTEALWESMKDLVIKTIISGEASISSLTKANVTSRYNCYELFGIDVLLDEDLKPWLLEVNISPSLHSASPLDIHVKGPLVSTVLNIAQFQVPLKTNLELLTKEKPHKLGGLPYDGRLYTVYLSKEERDKHIIYTNMADRDLYLRDILSTLTPDDVRHLVQAEDELTQASDMQRVFPTRDTHRYLAFLTGPRYYNRLFDAWETRYQHNREAGLDVLRKLCEIGYHLEVPPVPLKRAAAQLSALDRSRMTWTLRRRPPQSAPLSRPSRRSTAAGRCIRAWSSSALRPPHTPHTPQPMRPPGAGPAERAAGAGRRCRRRPWSRAPSAAGAGAAACAPPRPPTPC